MAYDSSTGGYLVPAASPAPLEDDGLMSLFQGVVMATTGLPGALVRPRWQAQAPNMPGNDVAWAAISVPRREGDYAPYVRHVPGGDGSDELQRHEELDLLCSFYGPTADRLAAQLRDGLGLAQNREALLQAGAALIEVQGAIALSFQLNNLWYYRIDITVRIRRQIFRVYPVFNLLSAQIIMRPDPHGSVVIGYDIEVTLGGGTITPFVA